MGGRWQQNLRNWQKMSEKREKMGQKVGGKLGKTGKILYLCIMKKSINKHTNLIYEN